MKFIIVPFESGREKLNYIGVHYILLQMDNMIPCRSGHAVYIGFYMKVGIALNRKQEIRQIRIENYFTR